MAAIDFPASPVDAQLFFAPSNGVTYRYSSATTSWVAVSTAPRGGGDFYAANTTQPLTTTLTTILFATVLSGNAGGYYSSSTGRFTPPAGRYRVWAGYMGNLSSGVTAISVYMRKNGTNLSVLPTSSTPGANLYTEVTNDQLVDMNGTDWIDVQMNGSTGTSVGHAWFGAIPVGIVQPMVPPGMMQLYSESILAAPANTIDVTFPANAKRIDLSIAAQTAAGANHEQRLLAMIGGTPDAATNYQMAYIYNTASATTPQASYGAALNGWVLTSGNYNYSRLEIERGVAGSTSWFLFGQVQSYQAAGSGHINYHTTGFAAPTGTPTGFSLRNLGGNFAAGSLMRAFVVT